MSHTCRRCSRRGGRFKGCGDGSARSSGGKVMTESRGQPRQHGYINFRVLALASGLVLSGCATGLMTTDPVISDGTGETDFFNHRRPFNLDDDCFPEQTDRSADDGEQECRPAYVQIIEADSAEDKKTLRNRLYFLLLRRSNANCEQHKAAILANHSQFNFLSTASTGILSGVSALVTGTLASQVMAATASGITVTQSAFNEKMLYNILAPAIVRKIEQFREVSRQALEHKVGGDFSDYHVDEMLMDITRHNQSCSIYHALSALVNDQDPYDRYRKTSERLKVLEEQLKKNQALLGEINQQQGNGSSERQAEDIEAVNEKIRDEIIDLNKEILTAPDPEPN